MGPMRLRMSLRRCAGPRGPESLGTVRAPSWARTYYAATYFFSEGPCACKVGVHAFEHRLIRSAASSRKDAAVSLFCFAGLNNAGEVGRICPAMGWGDGRAGGMFQAGVVSTCSIVFLFTLCSQVASSHTVFGRPGGPMGPPGLLPVTCAGDEAALLQCGCVWPLPAEPGHEDA